MHDAVEKRGHGDEEADQWAGGSDVEEGARGANGRADEDEGAERADECRKGNEERIACANVMMTAGEEMAEFMGEQNGQQSEGEGQACCKGAWVFVKKGEGFEELVEGNGLILRVGEGKLSSGDETGAKREKKQSARDEQHLKRRAGWNRGVGRRGVGNGAPAQVGGSGWRRIFWEWSAHEVFCAVNEIDTHQYSTILWVRASIEGRKNLLGMIDRRLKGGYFYFLFSSMP